MHRVILLFLVGLFLVPTTADAGTGKFMCPTAHFLGFGGTVLTVYSFLNGSAIDPVTIERLTIRNAFGVVVHDSGPAIGVDHPLNTSFDPDEDITVIAPRSGVFFKTTHIWGFNPIPDLITGEPNNQQGFFVSTVVEFSTAGKAAVKSFRVMAMRRLRVQGEERTTTRNYCFRIKE